MRETAACLSKFTGAVGAWIFLGTGSPESGSPDATCVPLLDSEDNPLWPVLGDAVLPLARRVLERNSSVTDSGNQQANLVGLPFHRPGQPAEAMVVAWPKTTPVELAAACSAVAGGAILQWRSRKLLEITGEHAQAAHRMLGVCRSVSTADSLETGSVAVVNQLAAITGAIQVGLTRAEPGRPPKLLAVSGVEAIDRRSPLAEAILRTAGEPPEKGSVVWQSGQIAAESPELAAYGGMIHAVAAAASSHRPADGSRITFVFGFAAGPVDWEPLRKRLEQLGEIAAGQIGMATRVHAPLGQKALAFCRSWLRERVGKTVLAIFGGLLLLMLLPWPYRVAADARLEPVARRFLTAPFDATLERTFAKNGDSVKAGDVVAVLDGRDLRLELAALTAEMAGSRKRHDSSLAAGDIAAAQVSRNESLQNGARLELIQQRLKQLEIRAPMDGVIVSGDLDTAEGAALKTGETLFEIGPLERIRAEILIPESELRHLRSGARATIWLAAWPFDAWSGVVTKIHQRSEIVDDQNCFVAEIEVDNANGRLRPGMKGRARIESGWGTVGWNWLHRAWERSRYLMVW